MKFYAKPLTAAGILTAAGLALTGCSGSGSDSAYFDGKSAGTIADEAMAATKSAKSVRVTTEGVQQGQKSTATFEVAPSGSCRTTMVLPSVGKVESVTADGAAYSKGGPAYMKVVLGSEAAAKDAAGRWVKSPEKPKESTCRIEALFKKDALKGATRGADSQVDGHKTATLEKSEQGGKSTIHVATEGKPYILRVVTEGASKTTATFSSFNSPIEVAAPPAAEVVEGKPQS
ncbi:hypothetical protein ACIBI4_23340 [Streptomyces sp. NPDC050418]|uniref:hypothetical protein n=1 Tax=Streptomyces sp. NPDC050418 TaxID=3365612 RepID=UPI00379CB982